MTCCLNLMTAALGAVSTAAPPGSYFGMPPQASTIAGDVDWVYNVLMWIMWFFFILIMVVMVYFVIKYRRKSHVADTGGATHNTPLEVTWTIIPMILVIGIFYIGLKGYVRITTPPENSYQIDAIGQKWFWTFRYPNGAAETNTLYVPVNRPVQINLSAEDVLHALFIPAFRVKQDAVPGRHTELWFEATHVGEYDLYCAEYCGTDHSRMIGKVVVYDQDAFDVEIEKLAAWIDKVPDENLHHAGALLYNQCSSCHTLDGDPLIGPSFKDTHDLFKSGGNRRLKDGSTVRVDEAYIRDSIENPLQQIGRDTNDAPYPSSMPPGIGRLLGDRKTEAMVRFIMKLDEVAPNGELIEVVRENLVVEDRPEAN